MRFTKLAFILIFSLSLSTSKAWGERPAPSNPYQFIALLMDFPINDSGAMFLPASVYEAQMSGSLSPALQFVLLNHMMNSCMENSIQAPPQKRDTFPVALVKYNEAHCALMNCFKQGLMMAMMSTMSQQVSSGGSPDGVSQSSSEQQLQSLAQAFSKDSSCGSGDGIDPLLVQAITAAASN